MTPKPDLRLQARSGVPVAKLLLAQYEYRSTSGWTLLEYGTAIGLLALLSAALCWVSSQCLTFLGH